MDEEEGRITGIVDWEEAGWYPEYWEYVKFLERPAEADWKEIAGLVFGEGYGGSWLHIPA